MTIVDAEELGGAMTEKLAGLFDETAAPEPAKPARLTRRGGRRREAAHPGLRSLSMPDAQA